LALESERLPLDEETLREAVRAVLQDSTKGRYYLAECEGEATGQLLTTFEWSDWRNGMFLWIQSVYVAPAYRRQGVFTTLFRHVELRARALRACGLRLYVLGENAAAHATYARLGMVASGYNVLETPDPLRTDG
jgi:GNAT superfamily N-acetyltransferase